MRWLFACLSVLLLLGAGEIQGLATELPSEWQALLDAMPAEIEEGMEGLAEATDAQSLGESVSAWLQVENVLRVIGDVLGVGCVKALPLLGSLCTVLVLCALMEQMRYGLGMGAMAGVMSFCSSCAVFAAVLLPLQRHLSSVVHYFEQLLSLMGAMIPVTGAIYVMGGNVGTAGASSAALYAFLGVCQWLCASAVVPVCSAEAGFALIGAVNPHVHMGKLGKAIKRIYIFLMGLVMTVLVFVLGAQTSLSSAADSVAARAAKHLSASMIPTVGGSVGDTLRTVGAGVGYLKQVTGYAGVIGVLLLTLPLLAELLLVRTAFLVSTSVAQVLGCDREAGLLEDMGSVWGNLVGAVAMTSVMFILALVLFVKTAVAMAG